MSDPLFRPLVTVIRVAPDERWIEVTLDLAGWITSARADVEDGDMVTAAGVATCRAVQDLMPPGIELGLAWAQQIDGDDTRRAVVHSSVELRGGREIAGGEDAEELLGAAFVRTDPQVAAVRATLDGLTRRLARYAPDE